MTLTRDIWHHRGNTAADLASFNPTLADREICFETDTLRFKVGPGAWNDLDYWGGEVPARNMLSIGRRTYSRWPISGGTTHTNVGADSIPSLNGQTSNNSAASDDGILHSFTGGTASGSLGGTLFGANDRVQPRWLPRCCIRFRTPSSWVGDYIHVGFADSIVAASSNQASRNIVGIRYSHPDTDGNWKAITADAVNQSITDTGVAVALNTTYTLIVDFEAEDVAVILLGSPSLSEVVEVARITTGLPANTALLYPTLHSSSASSGFAIGFLSAQVQVR